MWILKIMYTTKRERRERNTSEIMSARMVKGLETWVFTQKTEIPFIWVKVAHCSCFCRAECLKGLRNTSARWWSRFISVWLTVLMGLVWAAPRPHVRIVRARGGGFIQGEREYAWHVFHNEAQLVHLDGVVALCGLTETSAIGCSYWPCARNVYKDAICLHSTQLEVYTSGIELALASVTRFITESRIFWRKMPYRDVNLYPSIACCETSYRNVISATFIRCLLVCIRYMSHFCVDLVRPC